MTRYFSIFIFGFSLCILSCVNNDTSRKTNKELFESGQHSDAFLEIDEYVPETYTEVTIDSTSSNGYTVNATFSTDMENAVMLSEKIDSLTQYTHFRELTTKVKVYKDDAIVFDDNIDKNYLLNKGVFTKEEANRFAIIDFDMQFNTDGTPILTLHYTHTTSNEIKIIRFVFQEDKSFFEIIT